MAGGDPACPIIASSIEYIASKMPVTGYERGLILSIAYRLCGYESSAPVLKAISNLDMAERLKHASTVTHVVREAARLLREIGISIPRLDEAIEVLDALGREAARHAVDELRGAAREAREALARTIRNIAAAILEDFRGALRSI